MTQRDDYVALLVSHVGDRYSAVGDCRCHGTCPGWDCSGFVSGDLLKAAGGPYLCGDTDSLAQYVRDHRSTCTRAQARATKGAWAIRTKQNPLRPGDGHIVISLGDGRTVEAHDTADGVYIGTFDGNRGFQVYGYPPLAGFNVAPGPTTGPTTPGEAADMGMPAAIVPGSHLQTGGVWNRRYPFIGFVKGADNATDAVGFNGVEITNGPDGLNPKGATSGFGVSVFHLGVLDADVSAVVQEGPLVVGLAGNGRTFPISSTVHYL